MSREQPQPDPRTSPGQPNRTGPVALNQVLWDELRHLGRRPEQEPDAPALSEVYEHIHKAPRPLTALCFSGGGIRSATFNLGVTQALARLGVLLDFDYLSSVSGGGYIAGWLHAWMHRTPPRTVADALKHPPDAEPIRHLRAFSNYLTPRRGFFSADTWAAVALYVRNLILNWLVLVPGLAALTSIPQGAMIVAGRNGPDAAASRLALIAAVVLSLGAYTAIWYFRRPRGEPFRQVRILTGGVLPLWCGDMCLAMAGLWLSCSPSFEQALPFAALWCLVIPLAGWLIALAAGPAHGRRRWKEDLAGIVLAGAATSALMALIVEQWLPYLSGHPPVFVALGVPILLGIHLLGRVLFVACASLGETAPSPRAPRPEVSVSSAESGFADREWWARLSGWVLLLALAWMAISTLVLLGAFYFGIIGGRVAAAVGGLSGLATALLGAHPSTPAGSQSQPREPSLVKSIALASLAPVTLICVVVLLAKLSAWGAGWWTTHASDLLVIQPGLTTREWPAGVAPRDVIVPFVLLPLSLAAASWVLGWLVNVNRFSAQGLYRNRLVRAYLGASNPRRTPNPFTGFDPNDNLLLHALARTPRPCPLPVLNATLNLVHADDLAWQQRKAESFSMTPLYCGNLREGYRPCETYGGVQGISLGTAMAISGAAANPSAGYNSSPLVSFLMTLFNVRLGSWLGNPNRNGDKVYRSSGPRQAWKPLLADLFGLTDNRHAYVSLSDGGHFENLGVYEMVLRRCRCILAVDAGQDSEHTFEDLGGLVRKVRVDFGIRIEFGAKIDIRPRTAQGPGTWCALGTIHYGDVEPGAPDGQLLYLKPTLRAGGPPLPADVDSYAETSETFPHESTADQWFTEAQFESYRALGQFLAEQLPAPPQSSVAALFDEVCARFAPAAGGNRAAAGGHPAWQRARA